MPDLARDRASCHHGSAAASRAVAREGATLEFWQFITIGTQAIVAAATVGALWLAARKDSRDARTEFQQSVETLITGKLEALEGRIDGRLEALDGKIDGIRTENADIKVRLNAIDDHLRQRRVR